MSVLVAALLMQYVISVKAGLINHVQGTANVASMETARAGQPIRTGSDGYVEVLLRPGTFLRLGENSEARIDDVDLANVKVTVTRGPALIEVVEIDKDYPITVTTGNLTMKVNGSGIFKFADGNATVIQGKLQTGDTKLTYEKGWQIFFQNNYRARKISTIQETSLDIYSQTRSGTIASANFTMANSLRGSVPYGDYDIWLYSPYLRFYTFIPRSDYRSPYGYRYYGTAGNRIVRQVVEGNNTSSDSGGGTTRSSSSNNDNSNSSTASAPVPAPTAATPSGERSAPSVYIDSKSSPVGATAR